VRLSSILAKTKNLSKDKSLHSTHKCRILIFYKKKNMKNTLAIFLILFIPIIGFSQVQIYDFGRNYTDSLPPEFKLEVSEIRNRINGTIPENFKQRESQRRAGFIFSDRNALSKW
jgi:hypothetical protein